MLKKTYIMKMNILLGKTKKFNNLPTTYVCCVQAFVAAEQEWVLVSYGSEDRKKKKQ
jgi:microcompartment protein CcmK/EutM